MLLSIAAAPPPPPLAPPLRAPVGDAPPSLAPPRPSPSSEADEAQAGEPGRELAADDNPDGAVDGGYETYAERS